MTVLFLCCILCLSILSDQNVNATGESRLVNIAQGPVRGYRDTNEEIFVFYGIPYATAPKGPDKFKAPLPAPTWLDTFEAVDNEIICPQGQNFTLNMVEDCLIANVYVPDTEEEDLPVVVYIHGGAFELGYGNLLTPKKLVSSKKVIIVTFNYRLGLYGFLCLGTKDIPGNAALKDQVALLRWVNKNIAAFGGNPDDVTLAGYSAGSASVDLLMLSPSTRGLFKRVIPESGPNLAAFAVQVDPLEKAKKHAQFLKFDNVNDLSALEEFYKNASYDLLTSVSFYTRIQFGFTPCIERDLGQETFLVESPINILKNGNYVKVPILYGFANMEGLFRIPFFETWKDLMNDKFTEFLPIDLQFDDDEQKEEVARIVKKFYFGDEPVGNDNALGFIDFFTDTYFAYGTLRSAKMQVAAGNTEVYLYEYSFVDDNDTPAPGFPNIRGAPHCAQTGALMDGIPFITRDETNLSEKYKNMKASIRKLWINFMTTGKPVPEASSSLPAWPPMSPDGFLSPHMSLNETIKLRGPLLEERFRFWDEIYEKHYREPIPPAMEVRAEL